jgi:hypothetical protein
MMVQHSSSREYDDKLPPGDAQGSSSSMHLDYSSNLVYPRGSSGNQEQNECIEVQAYEAIRTCLNKKINRLLLQVQCKVKCGERKDIDNHQHQHEHEHSSELHQKNVSDNSSIDKIIKNHSRCKGSPCPIQKLKRKLQHFIFNSRKQRDNQSSSSGN